MRSHCSLVGIESVCNAGDPVSIPGSRKSTGKGIGYPLQYSWAFLVAQLVKNLHATRETWVRSLGWEDPLEKEMATHSSVLASRTSCTEEPGRAQSMGSQRVRHNWATFTLLHFPSKEMWDTPWLQAALCLGVHPYSLWPEVLCVPLISIWIYTVTTF